MCEFAEERYSVVWDEDSSVSVISGKLIVTPSDVGDTVKTSPRGPPYGARIAGHGEGTL